MQTNEAESSKQSRGGLHRSSEKSLMRVRVMTERAKGAGSSKYYLSRLIVFSYVNERLLILDNLKWLRELEEPCERRRSSTVL